MRIPIAISVQWWTLVSSSHLTRNEQVSGSSPLVVSQFSLDKLNSQHHTSLHGEGRGPFDPNAGRPWSPAPPNYRLDRLTFRLEETGVGR
jgi:hypothetical protein